MDATFLSLFSAYLISEFPLRPHRADGTTGPWHLVQHLVTLAVLSTAALGAWHPTIIAVLVAVRLATAAVPEPRTSLRRLIVQQGLQIAAIAGVAWLFPTAFGDGWGRYLAQPTLAHALVALTLTAGLILSVQAGGVVIGLATQPFRDQVDDDLIRGLRNGSLYIGWLERSLVMLLVLVNQTAGVGFLITAKSILRFSDVQDPKHRMASEYIILGTFMSFGWGLLVAVATHWTIQHWLTAAAQTVP